MSANDRLRRLMPFVAALLFGTAACGGGGSGTPSPTPTMHCNAGWSFANPFAGLRAPARYWISDTVADAGVDVEMQALVQAEDAAYSIDGRHLTGRLRLSLWALPPNGQIGANGVVGHLIARTALRMVGGQGAGQDQLWHVSAAFVKLQASGTAPPAGTYCIAMSSDEETATGDLPCATQDRFCLDAWYTFDGAVTFK